MSVGDGGLEIRELNSVAEMKRAEHLQEEVWGEGDKPDNSDIMLAIQHEGGLVAGAFHDGRMLGFLFAFPTSTPGVQHSHRLAVHPDSQGLGLGVRLKWYQRDWCLARGITLARWTYDPLRAVNAHLNIAKLGASAGTYLVDYYGQMEGINAGGPSDRLLAEWHLEAPAVLERLGKLPKRKADPFHDNRLRIAIPGDFPSLLRCDPDAALSERFRVRAELTAAFDIGYRIVDFNAEEQAYLLSKHGPI